MIESGQIYFFPRARVGRSQYPRPGLVLRVSATDATVCYFSTKFDLKESGAGVIEKTDPEFSASGLKHSSYLLEQAMAELPAHEFKGAKLLGKATGEFKKRVEEWYGAPLQ